MVIPTIRLSRESDVWKWKIHKQSWELLTFGKRQAGQYLFVSFKDLNGRYRNISVARCMLWTFVGKAPSGTEASHKDHNKRNNHIDNLIWETHAENMERTFRLQRTPYVDGDEDKLRAIELTIAVATGDGIDNRKKCSAIRWLQKNGIVPPSVPPQFIREWLFLNRRMRGAK